MILISDLLVWKSKAVDRMRYFLGCYTGIEADKFKFTLLDDSRAFYISESTAVVLSFC
jgi:hypothetical protein